MIILREWYKNNGKDDEWFRIKEYVAKLISDFENLDDITDEDLQMYLEKLRNKDQLNLEVILGLARLFKLNNNHQQYIYFTKLLGGHGVLESIHHKATVQLGQVAADNIFYGCFPDIATAPKNLPDYIERLMKNLNTLDENTCNNILADNHHNIPEIAFENDIELYKKSACLDDFLKQRHENKISELEKHMEENKVWFEQIITQDVIDFVRKNQEVLSAVHKDNCLYVTKIPYDTKAYLNAENDIERRYHYCHCPFVKESILLDKHIDEKWCNCSGGFAKYPFEVIFNQTLEVEVLESVLKGNQVCRFKIKNINTL